MSDDTTTTDPPDKVDKVDKVDDKTPPDDTKTTLPDDPAALAKVISDLRKENAAHRVKNKELEPLAAKAREIEDAAKSDLERAVGERDSERKRADDAEIELARSRAALKYDLTTDDLDLLGTGTAEEIEQRAERLAQRLATSNPQAGRRPDPTLGRAETPTASGDDWLRSAARR